MGKKKRLDPKLPIPDTTDPESKPDSYQDRLRRRLNELFLDFDGGTLSIYDEGVYLGEADGMNFIGTSVTAAFQSTLQGVVDVTITGGGSSATAFTGVTVLDEGITQGSPAAVDTFNFVGGEVAATVTANVATVTVTSQQNPLYVYFA